MAALGFFTLPAGAGTAGDELGFAVCVVLLFEAGFVSERGRVAVLAEVLFRADLADAFFADFCFPDRSAGAVTCQGWTVLAEDFEFSAVLLVVPREMTSFLGGVAGRVGTTWMSAAGFTPAAMAARAAAAESCVR